MQILLANAKIMFEKADRKPISVPLFQSVANDLAKEMAMMNVEELAKQGAQRRGHPLRPQPAVRGLLRLL